MPQKTPNPIQKAQKILWDLKELPRSPRMPVLFIGHGSPMNAIEDNIFTKTWRTLGKKLPKPHTIIVMSAHWVTTGSFITAMPQPKMIYDMYGFPEELYTQQYPASGNPSLAQDINAAVCKIQLDHTWGLDHGAWSVLKQMYPLADIPVLQLSVNYSRSPQQEYLLLKDLTELRDHGVLFIGSGNIVHNLQAMNWSNTHAYDWALEFDALSSSLIQKRDTAALVDYTSLGAAAQLSIPTDEHYRPMLGTLALSHLQDSLTFFNEEIVMGSVGMRSFILQ